MGTVFELKNVRCEFGASTILSDVSFSAFDGDRIGIVGDNGSGKTTLLNILTGKTSELSVSGSITRTSATVGYLMQGIGGDLRSITVYEDYLEVMRPVIAVEERIRELEADLTAENSAKLTALYEKFNEMGGLTYISRIKSTLSGLKFTESMRVCELSGGQKIRLALGKLLLENPSVLLLDEPTNHLDTESIEFLEGALKSYVGTVIVVSHDRHFLDAVTTKTLLIDNDGSGTLYNAPYSKYKELRDADIEYERKLFLRQQKEIAHINDVIKTQKMWNQEHNYVTAAAWQKKLDRMEIIEDPSKVSDNLPSISFEAGERGGNDVLLASNLGFAYPGSMPLFEHFNLDVKRGERIVLCGGNGLGKTTLLRLLIGELTPSVGNVKIGANVTISYYSQNFSDLSLTETPFDEIFDAANYEYYHNQGGLPKFVNIYKVRSALAAFGFSGDDCFKEAGVLSGGEKARLAMLKLTYKKANLLILDEPTNHLDIKTCEILEDALKRFDGTVICVSHDRYFAERIATRTIKLEDYACGENNPLVQSKSQNAPSDSKADYLKNKEELSKKRKLEKQKESLEREMLDLECKISELSAFLDSGSSDYEKISEAYKALDEAKSMLEAAENKYLEICD